MDSTVLDALKCVPSYLDLDFASFPPNLLSRIYGQIGHQEDIDEAEDSESLWTNKNLEAYVAFLHNDMEKSRSCNSWVYERQPQNIQAIVMKCLLLHKSGEMEGFHQHLTTIIDLRADEQSGEMEDLKMLKDLSADEHLITEAKCENAYAYSRMGPNYYSQAISLYVEAIEKYPTEYAWKYRLAVIKRRCLYPEVLNSWPSMTDSETFLNAKQLFLSVVNNSSDVDLRAMSYVELASLHCGPCARDELLEKIGMSRSRARDMTIEYLNNANELVEDNEKVLTETGRMFRRMKKFEDALEVLEKAYNLRSTYINCYQLGLVLQKIEGPSPRVITYLEESKDLSCGTNRPALLQLGKVYMHQSNARYDEAMECFTLLTEAHGYFYKQNGFEWKSKCYKEKLRPTTLAYQERRQIRRDLQDYQRKTITFAVMHFLKRTSIAEREKISLGTLLGGPGNRFDLYSSVENVKRLIHEYKMSEMPVRFLSDMNRIRNSNAVHEDLRKLVNGFYTEGNYRDCLDLVMLLMMTDINDRERLAVTTILNIIEQERDDDQLVSDCFTRLMDGFITEEIQGHVRLIFNKETSQEEVDVIKSLLEKAGLVVKQNDEGVLPFTNKTTSLINVMSVNAVIICLFKNNNTNLLDNFPIDELPNNHPVVLSMSINGSDVATILQNNCKLDYPEPEVNGKWLKEFGEKVFNPLLDDITNDKQQA